MSYKLLCFAFSMAFCSLAQSYELVTEKERSWGDLYTISQKYADGTVISFGKLCIKDGKNGVTTGKWELDLAYSLDLSPKLFTDYYRVRTGRHDLCSNMEGGKRWECRKLEGPLPDEGAKSLIRDKELVLFHVHRPGNFSSDIITDVVGRWGLDWYPAALNEANEKCLKMQDEVGSHIKRILNKLF